MSAPQYSGQPAMIERAIAAACEMAVTDEIKAIHVVTTRRPNYQELIRYRSSAASRGLSMTVLGAGGVVLRPSRGKPAFVGGLDAARVRSVTAAIRGRSDEDRAQPTTAAAKPIHRRLAPAWLGELHTMREGTR